jgi:DNA gyrase subunit A
VTQKGFGKRSSAYEYRVAGRAGQGIIAMVTSPRNGDLVCAFPVEEADQIMLITDQGQMIRCPVDDVRIAGRATQGVTLFRVEEGERVVSVERIGETAEGDDGGSEAGNGAK